MVKLSGEVAEVAEGVDGAEGVEEEVTSPQEQPTPEEPAGEEVEQVADVENINDVVDVAIGAVKSPDPEDPIACHEEAVAAASAEVGVSAMNWANLQEATKSAKKRFDLAVAELRSTVSRGPEKMPLFDKVTAEPETPPPNYTPSLERGQVRVKIGKVVADDLTDVVPPEPGAVIVCNSLATGNIQWGASEDDILDIEIGDEYEVLEEWPTAAEMPIIHQPPLQFPRPAPSPESLDWQKRDIAELGLTAKQNEKLGVETIGQLEELRRDISLGNEKWPKGFGPAAVTKVENAVLDWLRDNGPKPTE